MRLLYLAPLLPLAFAAPAKDLNAQDWLAIQSGFTGKVWNAAADWIAPPRVTNDEEKTVWQVLQEKEEFSKLVKLIKVGFGRSIPANGQDRWYGGKVPRRRVVADHLLCTR